MGLMKFNVKKSKNTKVCDMVKLQLHELTNQSIESTDISKSKFLISLTK